MTTSAMGATPVAGHRSEANEAAHSRPSSAARRARRLSHHFSVAACALCTLLSGSACRSSTRAEPSEAPQVGEATVSIKKAENTVSAIPGKPIFDLRLDIEGCPHDVYLNGGLVERNFEPTPAHIEYQVNHFMRSGSNELEVQLIQMTDEPLECDVKVALRWKDESAPPDTAPVTLLTLAHDAKTAKVADPTAGSSASGTFDALTGLPRDGGALRVHAATLAPLAPNVDAVRVLRRSFELPLSFPEWAYLRSEKLTLDYQFQNPEQEQTAYDALLAQYNELHTLLAKGDLDGFVNACEERSREIDAAYYKAPGSTRRALETQLKNAMTDEDFELADLRKDPGKRWGYFVGSEGTLAALYQGTRASTIFRYQLKDGSAFSLVFPVFFRKESGKFIVAR
jgi:hypothetical protein